MADVDVYGPNPEVERIKLQAPEAYAMAVREGTPPKMFAAGTADLPPFTASGVEPRLLTRLPYTLRHAAASADSRGYVLDLLESYADMPGATIEHPGLRDYINRVQAWATGRTTS